MGSAMVVSFPEGRIAGDGRENVAGQGECGIGREGHGGQFCAVAPDVKDRAGADGCQHHATPPVIAAARISGQTEAFSSLSAGAVGMVTKDVLLLGTGGVPKPLISSLF